MHKLAFLLLVVGGLNWLLLGVFSWDLGALFGGQEAVVSRILYILFGLSAAYELFMHKASCKSCMESKSQPSQPTAS